MSLGKELSDVASTYRGDVRLIGEFISSAGNLLIKKLNKKPNAPFTAEEIEQLRLLADAFEKAAEKAKAYEDDADKSLSKKERHNFNTRISISKNVSTYAQQVASSLKQRTFLAEMSLSYLISYQEAFIKDYLLRLLIHKHQLLKSGATISYEDIADHRSMRMLWSALAKKEVDALGYGNIDDVAVFFLKKLHIELSTYKKWELLREHSFRRNLIIHNRGIINDIYRKKTGTKQRTGHLETNIEYVVSAVDNIANFMDFIHVSVLKKFRLKSS